MGVSVDTGTCAGSDHEGGHEEFLVNATLGRFVVFLMFHFQIGVLRLHIAMQMLHVVQLFLTSVLLILGGKVYAGRLAELDVDDHHLFVVLDFLFIPGSSCCIS